MIYVIGVIALAFLGLFAGLKIESARVESYKTRATAAEQANKALDEACKAQVALITKRLQDNASADVARSKRTAATLAALAKQHAGEKAALDKDVASSKDATKLSTADDNAACAEIVGRYAKDAAGAKP